MTADQRADANDMTMETPRKRGQVLIIAAVVVATMIAGYGLARTFLPVHEDNP